MLAPFAGKHRCLEVGVLEQAVEYNMQSGNMKLDYSF